MHGTYVPSSRGKSGGRCAGDTIFSGRRATGRGTKAKAGAIGRKAAADSASGAGATPEWASIYDEVTARIVAEPEGGRVPWVQPWARDEACIGGTVVAMPRNALTSRDYSGINVLILWFAAIEQGYPLQGWLTFRQALEAGGSVRKGERGTTIVYADKFVPGTERERAAQTDEPAKAIPFLKRFAVFNVAQCDGLPADIVPTPKPLPERELVPVAEALIAASGVDFRIGGGEAFYSPGQDFVQVPPQGAFFEQINFYRTALHELTHATSDPLRLDRRLTTDFGSKDYRAATLTPPDRVPEAHASAMSACRAQHGHPRHVVVTAKVDERPKAARCSSSGIGHDGAKAPGRYPISTS